VTKLTSTSEQQEAPSGLTEHKTLKALVYPFEVIVSPLKAFKKIAQNPDIKGLVVIVGLIMLSTAGAQYASASKIFLGVSDRQSVSPKLHTYLDAYVYVTAFGNYTFKSSQPYVMNYTYIDKTPLIEHGIFWVNATEQLTPMNPVVTVANDTFYQTTVKLYETTTEVGNLTLTAIFYSETRPKMSTVLAKTTQWNLGNFTINWFIHSQYTYLANGSTAIDVASKATLSILKTNVKRAELGNTAYPNSWRLSSLIDWSDYGNATLYGGNHTLFTYSGSWLDVVFNVNDAETDPTTVGLTYSNVLTTNFFSMIVLSAIIQTAFFTFLLNWVIYAGVLILMTRFVGEKRGPWRPLFIAVGYAFSVLIVYIAVEAMLFSTLPEIHFEMSTWSSRTREDVATVNNLYSEVWGPTFPFQVERYLGIVFPFWLVMLGAIATHASRETKWGKALMISLVAYFTSVLLTGLLTAFLA